MSSHTPLLYFAAGQFWGIPVTVSTGEGNQYIELYDTQHEKYRRFPYYEYRLTWDHSENTCYYVGNRQGGPEGSHSPVESVIEGKYSQYNTGSLFGTEFEYEVFDESTCDNNAN